ncbi:MAG: tetratricopeptide repeat protein, partial [Fimbriiglobus sp.]
ASYAIAAARFGDPAGANDPAAAARLHWNLSDVLARKGDPAAALDHLRKFLAHGPTSPDPYRRLAELVRRTGAGEPAVRAALQQQRTRWPDHSAIQWVLAAEIGRTDPSAAHRLFGPLAVSTADARFFTLLARHYREARQPAGLLEIADDLYRAARPPEGAKPKNAQPKNEAPADPAAGERARAFTVAVRADAELGRLLLTHAAGGGLAGTPHAADTWELVAGLAERDRRLDLAERALRAAVEEAAGEQDIAYRLLDVLGKQRKWREILRECDRAGDRVVGRSAAHMSARARALAELGRPEAVDSVALIAQLGGGLWAQLEKPAVLNTLGKHREAADECERLLKDYPAPADARRVRLALADSLNGLKEYSRAEAELRTILDADPDDVLVLNNLAYHYADQSRNLAEAEAMIRQAMELDRDARRRDGGPDLENGVYLDSLGWVLFRRGKLADARAVFETASKLPDAASDPVVWDHLGDVAFRQGDADRAKAAWEEAAKLAADSHQGRHGDRAKEIRRKLRLVP